MDTEIEAKFANTDHDAVRAKLEALGGKCTQPNRLMRRVIVHTPEMTAKNAFIRVRDEGDRVTMTYKQFDSDDITGAKEYETVVGDFDQTVAILTSGGLAPDTYQESKRETWKLGEVEIMLDEWPWLNPYIEVEGPSVELVQETAKNLGFNPEKAIYGGVANIYMQQYPGVTEDEVNHQWSHFAFSDPAPDSIHSL